MDEELKAEIKVQELLLRVLLADLVQRQPALMTSVRDQVEQMRGASPEVDAVLQRWTNSLRLRR